MGATDVTKRVDEHRRFTKCREGILDTASCVRPSPAIVDLASEFES